MALVTLNLRSNVKKQIAVFEAHILSKRYFLSAPGISSCRSSRFALLRLWAAEAGHITSGS
eukprot:scaffold359826_cov19-Prasinocladus_malaysianus.AAC.1